MDHAPSLVTFAHDFLSCWRVVTLLKKRGLLAHRFSYSCLYALTHTHTPLHTLTHRHPTQPPVLKFSPCIVPHCVLNLWIAAHMDVILGGKYNAERGITSTAL